MTTQEILKREKQIQDLHDRYYELEQEYYITDDERYKSPMQVLMEKIKKLEKSLYFYSETK